MPEFNVSLVRGISRTSEEQTIASIQEATTEGIDSPEALAYLDQVEALVQQAHSAGVSLNDVAEVAMDIAELLADNVDHPPPNSHRTTQVFAENLISLVHQALAEGLSIKAAVTPLIRQAMIASLRMGIEAQRHYILSTAKDDHRVPN